MILISRIVPLRVSLGRNYRDDLVIYNLCASRGLASFKKPKASPTPKPSVENLFSQGFLQKASAIAAPVKKSVEGSLCCS